MAEESEQLEPVGAEHAELPELHLDPLHRGCGPDSDVVVFVRRLKELEEIGPAQLERVLRRRAMVEEGVVDVEHKQPLPPPRLGQLRRRVLANAPLDLCDVLGAFEERQHLVRLEGEVVNHVLGCLLGSLLADRETLRHCIGCAHQHQQLCLKLERPNLRCLLRPRRNAKQLLPLDAHICQRLKRALQILQSRVGFKRDAEFSLLVLHANVHERGLRRGTIH
mmetsp:Transcript_14913/g.32348  ORF Transcript_14913/g.32348 Transcript_14913/m.32348 type:complete len:222 (-) Transcript_14913:9-674(-)